MIYFYTTISKQLWKNPQRTSQNKI